MFKVKVSSYLLRGKADVGSVRRTGGSNCATGGISAAMGLFSFALGLAGGW